MNANLQYISDASGNTIGVFVPIEVWREITVEDETEYILNSPTIDAPKGVDCIKTR